jgi:hypothetical protein
LTSTTSPGRRGRPSAELTVFTEALLFKAA